MSLPLGVTFSFPTEQRSLSEATISSMGKGFVIPLDAELGARLERDYAKHRAAAIANDSVSTLISIFAYDGAAHRRATMGLILGTGCNATVLLPLSLLHPSKRHRQRVGALPGDTPDDVRIAVNTEWSINGTEPSLRQLSLITPWDDKLSAANERPGFQPLEYMTAGRYLGELGRIMLLAYMTEALGLRLDGLPPALLRRHGLTTTFLSHFRPRRPVTALVAKLRAEFPEPAGFGWTEHLAEALYRIAKAIELRAAAVVALLSLASKIPAAGEPGPEPGVRELGVGYTGGCIVHFQDYLADCQAFIDGLVARRLSGDTGLRVALSPCHDGGITGAGILVAAALSSRDLET